MSKKADSNPDNRQTKAAIDKVLNEFFTQTPVERNQRFQHGCETSSRPHPAHSLSSPSKPASDFSETNSVLLPRFDSPYRSQCECDIYPDGERDSDGIIRPPYGDVRDPTGSFYGPYMARVKAAFAGAAGNSKTIRGNHSASKYHQTVYEGATVPVRDFTPDSSRSNILRTSSHCV